MAIIRYIQINTSTSTILEKYCNEHFAIASPTAFEKGDDQFERNPVGTGPFKFVEWKPNDSITIEKFDDYWEEGLPKLDKIIFRSIPDNSARLNALMTGEIDLADGVNPSDGKSIEDNENLQLFERPSMNVGYFGFTVTRTHSTINKCVKQLTMQLINKQSLMHFLKDVQKSQRTQCHHLFQDIMTILKNMNMMRKSKRIIKRGRT